MVRSMRSAQAGSPVASSRRQASITLAIAAQVSAYARSGGSSYGSPKASSLWRLPEPAGQVRPRLDHVVPAPVRTDCEQVVVAELDGEVDHAAVEVQLAHGVAGDLGARRGPAGGPASTPGRSARPEQAVAAQVDHPARRARGGAGRRWSGTARRGPSRSRGARRSRRGRPARARHRPSRRPGARSRAGGRRRSSGATRSRPGRGGRSSTARGPTAGRGTAPAADDLDVACSGSRPARCAAATSADHLVGRGGERRRPAPRPSSQPTASSHL